MSDVVLASARAFLNMLTHVFHDRRNIKQIISEIIWFLSKKNYTNNLVIAISYNKLRKITNDWVTNVVRERGWRWKVNKGADPTIRGGCDYRILLQNQSLYSRAGGSRAHTYQSSEIPRCWLKVKSMYAPGPGPWCYAQAWRKEVGTWVSPPCPLKNWGIDLQLKHGIILKNNLLSYTSYEAR